MIQKKLIIENELGVEGGVSQLSQAFRVKWEEKMGNWKGRILGND